eukprot:11168929-Lingulodinium_polyedra.AAC.1
MPRCEVASNTSTVECCCGTGSFGETCSRWSSGLVTKTLWASRAELQTQLHHDITWCPAGSMAW